MKLKKMIPLLVTASTSATLIFSSCIQPSSGLSANGSVAAPAKISASMLSQGEEAFNKYKKTKKISSNSAQKAQLRRVASRLTKVIDMPQAKWEFVVFEDPEPNAFALPGGKVGVNSGLFQITQSDAGLAAVVGHEIAHVTLNHSGKRKNAAIGALIGGVVLDQVLSSQGASSSSRQAAAGIYGAGSTVLGILPFSRSQELQSDRIGSIYMAKAGYNPKEAVNLWKRFSAYKARSGGSKAPAFLSTHPLDSTRIQALENFVPTAMKSYKS